MQLADPGQARVLLVIHVAGTRDPGGIHGADGFNARRGAHLLLADPAGALPLVIHGGRWIQRQALGPLARAVAFR